MSARNGDGAGRLRPFCASPEGQFPNFADRSLVVQGRETSFLKIGFKAFGQRKEVMPHDG